MTNRPDAPQRRMWGLVGIFAASGVLHFARPRLYEAIVPRRLPGKRELVYVTGAAELACAAGLAVPRTRRLAGLVSAGLLVSVFPANIQMAANILGRGSGLAKVLVVARLPLQAPLVLTAWRAWHPSPRSAARPDG